MFFWRRASKLCGVSPSLLTFAPGVGHTDDEDALPFMAGTDIRSSQARPCDTEPEGGQVSENGTQSPRRSQAADVFQDDEAGSKNANACADLRPDPPLVLDALSGSGDTVRLAREARRDDVHQSTKACPGEVCEIACENRRRLQGRVFHPLQEEGRGADFPLDVAQNTQSAEGDVNAEIEHPDAAAQAESSPEGTIHVTPVSGTYRDR